MMMMMRYDGSEEDVGAVGADGGTKDDRGPEDPYLMKSASSELEALMGGEAGVDLLPPEAR